MKHILFLAFLIMSLGSVFAQTNPAIINWLQNTTEVGSYYMQGNSTAISNDILVNVQSVDYSDDWVYVTTEGVPAYPTGPFLDGNPSQATPQTAIFKIPLNPAEKSGTKTETTPANIGVFINGVALFDWRDGVAWNPQTNDLCGGPGNSPCPGGMGAQMDWNRDAIPAEKAGFDCSKGHPAMGNYHHHQNPSAFKLDVDVVSEICNLYDADGLYAIDSTVHSPLIGFAYDGFPIYGAYGYKNADGTGGVVRMESSYELSEDTTRDDGPNTSGTYFNGYFKEDYNYVSNSQSHYLDESNGRFSVTPEYPDGIYCYFATVDKNWNSQYPYVVGPVFYGTVEASNVSSISESVTNFPPDTASDTTNSIVSRADENVYVTIFPNPASDLIAIQFMGVVREKVTIEMYDLNGALIVASNIKAGSTISYLDTKTMKSGNYVVMVKQGESVHSQGVVVKH